METLTRSPRLFRGIEKPDVAYVGEEGALEDAYDRKAPFEVEDKLQVTHALEAVLVGSETTGSQASQLPGAHGGGAAAEEAFLVGHGQRIAIRQSGAE